MFRVLIPLIPVMLTLAACDDAAQTVRVDVAVEAPPEAFAQVARYPAAVVAGIGVRQGSEMFLSGFEVLEIVCEAPLDTVTTRGALETSWGPCNPSDIEIEVFIAPLDGTRCDVALEDAWWTEARVAARQVEVEALPAACGAWEREVSIGL